MPDDERSLNQLFFRLNFLSCECEFLQHLYIPPILLCLPILLPFEIGAHMDSQSSDKIIFSPQIIPIPVLFVCFDCTVRQM